MTAQPVRMGPFEWALLVVLSLIWGGSFLFGRIAVQEVPPMTVAFFRVSIATMVLMAALALSRQSLPDSFKAWLPFVVMGLVNNVIPFSLIFWGQQQIGAGLAAILNATTPLFAGVLAHLLTRDEKLGLNKVAGILIGIGGIVVLVGPEILDGFGGHFWAELAVLGAALSYGVAGLWGRRFRTTPPMVSATAQLTCSSLILLPLTLWLDRWPTLPWPSTPVLLSILGLAVICTAVAYVIFFTIIRRAGSANVMLVTLLIPVSAMLLGAALLGERLTLADTLGAAIVLLALVVIDGRALDYILTFIRRRPT